MALTLSTLGIFSFFEAIGTLQAILFIIGLILLMVEVFTPGFGIAGGGGIVLIIVGIFLTARTPAQALIMFGILLLLIAILLIIVLRSAKRGKLSKKIILRAAAKRSDGFSSTADTSDLIGKTGTALTILRPAGAGEFDGERLDVVTDGSFLESGAKIKIVRTEGRRIVVEKID